MDTVIFKIDKKLKQKLQKKCKESGITLSEFYRRVTEAFVRGDIVVEISIKPQIRTQIFAVK